MSTGCGEIGFHSQGREFLAGFERLGENERPGLTLTEGHRCHRRQPHIVELPDRLPFPAGAQNRKGQPQPGLQVFAPARTSMPFQKPDEFRLATRYPNAISATVDDRVLDHFASVELHEVRHRSQAAVLEQSREAAIDGQASPIPINDRVTAHATRFPGPSIGTIPTSSRPSSRFRPTNPLKPETSPVRPLQRPPTSDARCSRESSDEPVPSSNGTCSRAPFRTVADAGRSSPPSR